MSLTQPNQDLKRDLQGIASDLKWSAVELKRIADRLSQAGNELDAQAIMRMVAIFRSGEERLAGHAGDIAGGRVQDLSRDVGTREA